MRHMTKFITSPAILNFLKRLKDVTSLNYLARLSFPLLLLFVCFVVTTPAQSRAAGFGPMAGSTASTGNETVFAFERRAFDLINNERSKAGVRPLIWVERIANVARHHSSNMAESDFFGHADLQGRTPSDRVSASGIGAWTGIAENIVWVSGYDDPVKHAVESWMRSPGHRRNLMDPGYKESGIGAAITKDGKVYLTQDFMTRK